MSEYFITVVENEGEEVVELPLEEDCTLSLGTLQGQFPGSCGLKYRSPETGAWRGLRVNNGIVCQVNNDWSGNHIYVVVYPKDNKRKGEEGEGGEMETDGPKTKRLNAKPKVVGTCDLIVRNLPYTLEEDGLRAYFETFGELCMVQLKKDLEGKSRGFGFIRYKSLEDQGRCFSERHYIEGRSVEVKLPQSKSAGLDEVVYPGAPQPHLSRRIFVGRVTENIKKEDLENYFVKYGEIADVFVPNPFRMFAFVTFVDSESARALIEAGDDHLINGCSVNVAFASPMKPNEKKFGGGGGGGGRGGSGVFGAMPGAMPVGKMPDNPMEAMGMAMAMMNTWMDPNSQDGKRKQGGGGGGRGGYRGGPGGLPHSQGATWNTGYGGGYNSYGSGGYGTGGGSW